MQSFALWFSKKCEVTLSSNKTIIIFNINLAPITIRLVFLVDMLINFQLPDSTAFTHYETSTVPLYQCIIKVLQIAFMCYMIDKSIADKIQKLDIVTAESFMERERFPSVLQMFAMMEN